MTADDPDSLALLRQEVESFADQMTATIEAVLPDVDGRFSVLVSSGRGNERIALRQHQRSGLVLSVNGVPLMRLVVTYRLSWNGTQRYTAVESSQFKVFLAGSSVPLMRFDYLRQPAASVPSAHVNVHAHRDEVVFAMMRAGDRDRGRDRSRTIAEGRVPSMRELHIPLGGHRFRPCLEDVLQMLLVEFGLDRVPGYQAALDEGRKRYRVQQLRVAATDDLEAVADLLREMGYDVRSPLNPPQPRNDRLSAY
ncbi:hypothetical protein [Amnibacterium setariae]|uniref:Uncharacterized protein n=1 Tax=Amnibacterium setariae TaxID=2306585 RepID=A0A3A1U7K8_9MICO|nr:hypothetical protein [Amnibacterium setariae]RIX30269.1 hypothetical protein D1781_02170 [Amnibacterium setariae]